MVRTIYLGQINLILMAAIIWDLCQPDLRADGRRRWWKGALTGVAAGIKLVPLVFVPYLLITRRFREAAATVAGFAVTVAAGFAVLPHDSSQWWLHGMFLADGNRAGFMGWAGNQSLRAVITRFAGSVAAGQDPWIAAAVVALALGLTAAYLLERAGYPVPALLATALAGLLASPISWDHHWVWIAPAVAVTGHYALAARRPQQPGGARRTARWLWALAAGMIFFFAAWPDALWESARNLGNFSLGFLWAQPNTNPIKFAEHGDQPSYVEYHWHGFQLLWGNAYILAGVVLLAILLVLGWRLARRGQAASAAGRAKSSAPRSPERCHLLQLAAERAHLEPVPRARPEPAPGRLVELRQVLVRAGRERRPVGLAPLADPLAVLEGVLRPVHVRGAVAACAERPVPAPLELLVLEARLLGQDPARPVRLLARPVRVDIVEHDIEFRASDRAQVADVVTVRLPGGAPGLPAPLLDHHRALPAERDHRRDHMSCEHTPPFRV